MSLPGPVPNMSYSGEVLVPGTSTSPEYERVRRDMSPTALNFNAGSDCNSLVSGYDKGWLYRLTGNVPILGRLGRH